MIQFISAGLLATLLAYLSYSQKKDSFLVLAMFVMWYIAAFQDCIASDFIAYKGIFEGICQGKREFAPAFFLTDRRDQIEIGWYMLNKLISYVSSSFYVVSAVVYLFIFSVFYKLIKRAPLQWRWVAVFYLYFTPGWLTSIMSAERQTVAVALWILMFFAIQDKKYLKALVLIVLGISFHNSFLFSLPFLLLLLIPYERIVFEKYRFFWFIAFVLGFIVALVSIQSITEELSLLFMVFDDGVSEVYDKYLVEFSGNDFSQKMTTIFVRTIFFVFLVLAFLSKKRRLPNSNMYLALFLLSFLLMSAFGTVGNLARIFRYLMFLSLPAMSFAVCRLRKDVKWAFIVYTAFLSFYSLLSAFGTEQFAAYQNYHTIFF